LSKVVREKIFTKTLSIFVRDMNKTVEKYPIL